MTESRKAQARHSWVRSSFLLMSSGNPSKLLTSLNILITGKDRAPGRIEPREGPSPGKDRAPGRTEPREGPSPGKDRAPGRTEPEKFGLSGCLSWWV